MKKAIALVSGGLDSLLAAKLVQKQGIEVLGVVFIMEFASKDLEGFKARVQESSDEAGINVRFVDIAEEFLDLVEKPKHGYGANVNPCIDCKILMLKKAKEIMAEEKASFVVTGEVLGERPMSQRKEALNIIKNESGLAGYLLRPLSAKLLKETKPEQEGIIKRSNLLDFSGRSREPQLKLAKEYGLNKFFAPAGGCLLTEPIFARKIKDLLDHNEMTIENIQLLKTGRHFRLSDKTKVIIGRDKEDNEILAQQKKSKDVMLRFNDFPGPDVLIRGQSNAEIIGKAASLLISHSKKKNEMKSEVDFWYNQEDKKTIEATPMKKEEVEEFRI